MNRDLAKQLALRQIAVMERRGGEHVTEHGQVVKNRIKLSWISVRPGMLRLNLDGSIKGKYTGDSMTDIMDDKHGNLYWVHDKKRMKISRIGAIYYNTGVIEIEKQFLMPRHQYWFRVSYYYDSEAVGNSVRSYHLKMCSAPIRARSRRLAARWVAEEDQNLAVEIDDTVRDATVEEFFG